MSEELDQVFGRLVRRSWQRFDEQKQTREIDDLLVGAVIVAMVAEGNSLIDLNSDGNHHHLRFERPQDKQRVMFRLTHMTGNVTAAKTLGHYASVQMGYGERVEDTRTVWQALKSEVKSGFLDVGEPGVMTVDADLIAGYVYVQVELLLDLEPYFADNYTVRYPVLQQHLSAVRQALAKYLHGRLAANARA
ncbi:hypothetical protein GCM10010191_69980 [Actinomadura vinacea]|uniref:Uncharacterized protein n=1 Tax=Actinomadura vinacea TaxID=115336 RepID=A0ABN3JXR5_9ACTN